MTDTDMIQCEAERLVQKAAYLGVVLTIEQRPRMALSMGLYDTVVSVRPRRTGDTLPLLPTGGAR